MANNYDIRKVSPNAIQKVLDEESLVSKYLEDAKNELENNKLNQQLKDTSELRKTIDDIIEKRGIVSENIDQLYIKRNSLFENLLSAIIGNFYARKIIDNIEKYQKNINILSQVDPSKKNSDLMYLIQEMKDAVSIMLTNPADSTKIKLIDKIRELAHKLEDIFENIKSDMGFPDIKIGEEGELQGLGHIYSFYDSNFKGTIEFKGVNGKKLNDNLNIMELQPTENHGDSITDSHDIEASINIELLKDILIEDGSEANPYLIKNSNDFERFLDSDRDVYFRLMTDLTISKSKITIASNLDGNGHTLTFAKSCRSINFTGNISGTLNIIVSSNYFLFPYFFIPIFQRVTITFGMIASFKDGAKLNVYVNLNKVKPFLFVHPGKFLKIRTIGTSVNSNHADQIEFFYYSSNFSDDSYKITSTDFDNDPIEERHVTKKTCKLDLNIKKSSELPVSVAGDKSNTILEKGTSMKIDSASLHRINGEFYLKHREESEGIPNRVKCYGTGQLYIDLSLFKHSYNDDQGSPHDFYPFFNKLDTKLIRLGDNGDPNFTGALAVLAEFALIIILKNLDTDTATDENMEKILQTLTSINTNLESYSNSLQSSLGENLNTITGSIQTFQYIEEQRLANDPQYDSVYTQNLTTAFSTLFGYTATMTNIDDINEFNKAFKSLDIDSKIVLQETTNLTIGIVESLVLINKTIENYFLLFDLTSNYGSKLLDILNQTSTIIRSLNDLEVSAFYVVHYPSLRAFDSWMTNILKYTNDGIYSLGQIYIAQEFGLNALKLNFSSDDSIAIVLKYLVNDAVIRGIKKNLFLGEFKKSKLFEYEDLLEKNKNIIVHNDANYEQISPLLTNKIKSLEIYNEVDLSKILNGSSSSDKNDEEGIKTNLEIGNLLELIFINHIFKDNSNIESILLEINELFEIFSKCDKTFRNLLAEYHFKKVVKRLIDVTTDKVDLFVDTTIKYDEKDYTWDGYNFKDSDGNILLTVNSTISIKDNINYTWDGENFKDSDGNILELTTDTTIIYNDINYEWDGNNFKDSDGNILELATNNKFIYNDIEYIWDGVSLTRPSIFSQEDFVRLQTYYTNSGSIEEIQEDLHKYVAVWMFKDYVRFQAGGAILKFIQPELLNYLYKEDVFKNSPETPEEAFQDIAKTISNIWNKTSVLF